MLYDTGLRRLVSDPRPLTLTLLIVCYATVQIHWSRCLWQVWNSRMSKKQLTTLFRVAGEGLQVLLVL